VENVFEYSPTTSAAKINHFLIIDYSQPWMDGTKQERVVVCVGLGDGAQQGSVSKGPQ
jgi:hypothetical protein